MSFKRIRYTLVGVLPGMASAGDCCIGKDIDPLGFAAPASMQNIHWPFFFSAGDGSEGSQQRQE